MSSTVNSVSCCWNKLAKRCQPLQQLHRINVAANNHISRKLPKLQFQNLLSKQNLIKNYVFCSTCMAHIQQRLRKNNLNFIPKYFKNFAVHKYLHSFWHSHRQQHLFCKIKSYFLCFWQMLLAIAMALL